MTYYAEIDQNGVCFAELETSTTIDKPTMIPSDGFGKLGKKWNGSTWEDYTPPAIPKRLLTKLEYMDRFSDPELEAIYTAAKASVAVEVWLEKFKQATDINLDDERTIAGLNKLKDAGILSAQRVAEILA